MLLLSWLKVFARRVQGFVTGNGEVDLSKPSRRQRRLALKQQKKERRLWRRLFGAKRDEATIKPTLVREQKLVRSQVKPRFSQRMKPPVEMLEDRTLLVAPVFSQEEYNVTINQGYYDSWHVFGNVNAADPDNTFVGYYGGTNGFYIDGMSGDLRFNGNEVTPGNYTFTATASDEDSETDTATININISNSAPVFAQVEYTFEVVAGYHDSYEHLGTVSASDPDGGFVGYSGGTDGFQLDGMEGFLYFVNGTASVGTYTFTAHANDGFGGSDTATVTVNVIPRPNNAPVFSQSSYVFTVTANASDGYYSNGETLGTLSAGDPDGDPFGITGGVSGFYIDAMSGELRYNSYSTAPINTYTFTAYANDEFGGFDTAEVTIHVVPRPNTDPEFSQSVYDITVVANTPWGWDSYGQMLGVVNITDAEGDYIGTYTDNNLFQMNWGEIYLAWGNNTLAIGDYNFNIYATDSFGGLSTAVVNLHVVPRPNTPPVFTQEVYEFTINQGYYDGWSSLGNVLAIDAEGDFVGYSGSSYDVNNPTSGFYIETMSGELRYNSYHITPGSYTFTVTASDEFGGSDSATINIIVPNSPPVFTQEIYYFSIEPGEYAYDHVFGTVSAIDPDGGFVGYSGEFRDASNNLIFYVDPMSGEIRFNSNGSTGNINVASGSYFMTISASDEFGGSDVAEVTIIVNAPNQAPEFISDINPATELEYDGDEYHFDYDPADEGIVGYVTVEDEGDTTLTLEGEHSSLFTINEYGSIMAAGALAIGNYTFTVKTTDSAGLQDTATVFVTANYSPVFKQDVYDVLITLQELMAGGNGYMVAANILATDADTETVTYSILDSDVDQFSLDSQNGISIVYNGQLISPGIYTLYLKAEDIHGGSGYSRVHIWVYEGEYPFNSAPDLELDNSTGIYETDEYGHVDIMGTITDATPVRGQYLVEIYDLEDNNIGQSIADENMQFSVSLDYPEGTEGSYEYRIRVIEIAGPTVLQGEPLALLVNAQKVQPKEAPPTSATLKWEHFKGEIPIIDQVGEYDAATGYITKYIGSTVKLVNKQPKLFEASFTAISYSAIFVENKSWVKDEAKTNDLLEHERLHLKIAEYVMQKLSEKLLTLTAQGETQAAAETALKKARDVLFSEFNKVLEDTQKLYDKESKHSINEDGQKDWDKNYKVKIDGKLKSLGVK